MVGAINGEVNAEKSAMDRALTEAADLNDWCVRVLGCCAKSADWLSVVMAFIPAPRQASCDVF